MLAAMVGLRAQSASADDALTCLFYAQNAVMTQSSREAQICGVAGARYTRTFSQHARWCSQMAHQEVLEDEALRNNEMLVCLFSCPQYAADTAKQFEALAACTRPVNMRAGHWQPRLTSDFIRSCFKRTGQTDDPKYVLNPRTKKDFDARAADLAACR